VGQRLLELRIKRAENELTEAHIMSFNDNNWLNCPVCYGELKSKNFSKHLSNIHPDISNEQRRKLLRYKKKANKGDNIHYDNIKSIPKKNRFIRVKEINRETRSRVKKISLAIGIIFIIFLVAYTSAVPLESNERAQEFNPGLVCEVPLEIDTYKIVNWKVVSASNFIAKDVITGETTSLDANRGSMVLLNFVNYGCNANINKIVSAQLIAVKELYEERGDFEPFSVFCGCCPVETLKNFAETNEFNWTWVLDSDYTIIKSYTEYVSAYGYPTLVYIDGTGKIQDATGYLEKSELSAKIEQYV
jgi:uncharacterized C2H2 Zn-finger protein